MAKADQSKEDWFSFLHIRTWLFRWDWWDWSTTSLIEIKHGTRSFLDSFWFRPAGTKNCYFYLKSVSTDFIPVPLKKHKRAEKPLWGWGCHLSIKDPHAFCVVHLLAFPFGGHLSFPWLALGLWQRFVHKPVFWSGLGTGTGGAQPLAPVWLHKQWCESQWMNLIGFLMCQSYNSQWRTSSC